MVLNILLNSSKKPMLTIDQLEKVERKSVANLVGHVFQLSNRKKLIFTFSGSVFRLSD